MKQNREAKQIRVQSNGNKRSGTEREEQTVTVQPGDTPREVLAAAVGRKSDEMLLRKGSDGYLDQQRSAYEQVRDGEAIIASSKPTVG